MENGYGVSSLIMMLLVFGFIVVIIKVILNASMNRPTWRGIIISALLGLLPLYLVLCFLGIMGEDNDPLK